MRTVAVNAGHPAAAARLRAAGLDVLLVADGRELEAVVRAGRVAGVLDLRLGDVPADPDRLTAASLLGVPHVVGPGDLPSDLSPEAADRLGLDVAQKASAARGPAAVVLPLAGLTPAGAVFNQCVRNWAYGFEVVEVDRPADGPAFAAAAADVLVRLMG